MSHITPSSVIVQQDDDGLTAKDLQALDLLENDFDACFEYLTQPDPVCPSPAPQSHGASLAAPAEAVQEVCSRLGFVVPFPSEDKGIDREAYSAAVLDLAALLSEEGQIFDQLVLGLRQVASDSVAQHRGELDNLVEGCISHMRRFYGVAAQDVSELNSVHSSSFA